MEQNKTIEQIPQQPAPKKRSKVFIIVLALIGFRYLFTWITLGIAAGKLREKDTMYWYPVIEITLIFTQLNIFFTNIFSKPVQLLHMYLYLPKKEWLGPIQIPFMWSKSRICMKASNNLNFESLNNHHILR